MSDKKLHEYMNYLVERNRCVIDKACTIESKVTNKENKSLVIGILCGLAVYIIPKIIEMVI